MGKSFSMRPLGIHRCKWVSTLRWIFECENARWIELSVIQNSGLGVEYFTLPVNNAEWAASSVSMQPGDNVLPALPQHTIGTKNIIMLATNLIRGLLLAYVCL